LALLDRGTVQHSVRGDEHLDPGGCQAAFEL